MPPSMPPIFAWDCSSTFLKASLQAATIMSWSISTSPATSGSILTDSRFLCPSILTVTMPPPAVASTLIWASSCASFSCICCAWRIICCMLPGSFTLRLLEVTNFADFAAENFLETLHFRVGQGAAGGVIFARGRREFEGGGRRTRPGDRYLHAQRPAEDLVHRRFESAVLEIHGVGLGRDHAEFRAAHRDAGIFHRVGQVREALLVEEGMEPLARIAGGDWR